MPATLCRNLGCTSTGTAAPQGLRHRILHRHLRHAAWGCAGGRRAQEPRAGGACWCLRGCCWWRRCWCWCWWRRQADAAGIPPAVTACTQRCACSLHQHYRHEMRQRAVCLTDTGTSIPARDGPHCTSRKAYQPATASEHHRQQHRPRPPSSCILCHLFRAPALQPFAVPSSFSPHGLALGQANRGQSAPVRLLPIFACTSLFIHAAHITFSSISDILP